MTQINLAAPGDNLEYGSKGEQVDEGEVKDLIKTWYFHKAKNATDPFFRFLCLWICFNAWLEHRSPATTDARMIDWLIQQSADKSDLIRSYERMTSTTVGRQSLRAFGSMSPILDARGSRPKIVIRESGSDREQVIRAIFQIRCNLFHGGKQSSKARDQKLISCVNEIMNKWLSDLIASW